MPIASPGETVPVQWCSTVLGALVLWSSTVQERSFQLSVAENGRASASGFESSSSGAYKIAFKSEPSWWLQPSYALVLHNQWV